MTKRAKRILIPLTVAVFAGAVLLAVLFGPGRTPRGGSAATAPGGATPASAPPGAGATDPQSAGGALAAVDAGADPNQAAPQLVADPVPPLSGLQAVPAGVDTIALGTIGSLNPHDDRMLLEFERSGAGIDAVRFANIWETAAAKRKADEYYTKLPPGAPPDPSQLDESLRYVLQESQQYTWQQTRTTKIPLFAAHSIVINGEEVGLLRQSIWKETAPGTFIATIADAAQQPVAEITREFRLGNDFDVALRQHVRNLTDQPLEVMWRQYGPVEIESSGYIDHRRFDFGYLPDPTAKPNLVLSSDTDLEFSQGALAKRYTKAQEVGISAQRKSELLNIWPNSTTRGTSYEVSWFASISRYFGMAIHPLLDAQGNGSKSLAPVVNEVRIDVAQPAGTVMTFLVSPLQRIEPGHSADLSMGIYAGPLDRHILNGPPYESLAMDQLIIYSLGGCCSFLTFQWLAHLLLGFLALLHDYLVFDWGLAIIILVIVVRALLHPITKRSQINMQRFGKNMAAIKPELDKLQKKYRDDPKRLQQENLRLMREHGMNPLQAVGCLPMFLQMPIWIALWAMLYLAYDMRHQAAFYGLFQLFWDWNFLGDLSSPDMFLPLPGNGFTIPFVGWQIPSINFLPLLMGFVFFFQQKYMSPPPSPSMTPEQLQQQKIMKVMMVVLFPLFMYKAPAGLTLYICTSTIIGILESRYVRRHIEELDKNPPPPREKRFKKPKDALGRAWAEKIESLRQRRNQAAQRSFKKRK